MTCHSQRFRQRLTPTSTPWPSCLTCWPSSALPSCRQRSDGHCRRSRSRRTRRRLNGPQGCRRPTVAVLHSAAPLASAPSPSPRLARVDAADLAHVVQATVPRPLTPPSWPGSTQLGQMRRRIVQPLPAPQLGQPPAPHSPRRAALPAQPAPRRPPVTLPPWLRRARRHVSPAAYC